MSALDKLINLLEHLKETSPDMHDKANKALDVLLDEEDLVEETQPKPKYIIKNGKLVSGKIDPDPGHGDELEITIPDPEPEPEPEPEPVDDSYFEVEDEDTNFIVSSRVRIKELISSLGLLTQAYEADKEAVLEEIDQVHEALNERIRDLQNSFPLDPAADYNLVFPSENREKGAFIKMSPS